MIRNGGRRVTRAYNPELLTPTPMKRELIWVLSAKLLALGLLWLLFFSGAHRLQVGPSETGRQLRVIAPPAPAAPTASDAPAEPDPRSRPQERTGD
jgi:hypothetical protein